MSAVTPDSTIRLLKLPLRLEDTNQLTFTSLTAQTNFFLGITGYLSDSNLSYIRKDGVIRVGTSSSITYEDVLEYNYVMYQNTHYDSKWFYAYITNVEYKNDGCTEISIETDVFQTWMFDIIYLTSFIEREHVDDDTLGKHTVPENLEHGEYISNGFEYNNALDNTSYVLLATKRVDGTDPNPKATCIGDMPFAGYIYVFNNLTALTNIIDAYGVDQSNIYAVYSVPSYAVANTVYTTDATESPYRALNIPANSSQLSVSKLTTLNGYSPINNKVKCFPYTYLLVSNNNGQSNVLQYERFSTSYCGFALNSIATVGSDNKLVPLSYDGNNYDEQNALMSGKWPTLSWSQDMFTNWLSQNAVNIGIGQATSVLSIIGGTALIATGGGAVAGAGLIAGGIGGIASSLAQQYQHSMDPNSFKGNVNGGSINIDSSRNGFFFYKMSIKSEYAKIIDNYFEVYGYKVNRIGTPHIHVRTYWDYCKTINVHLNGNIPEKDMIKLRQLFNNGCTFWHDPSHFMDYSLTNSIIT